MKFEDLGLSKKVLAAVEASGYKEPTAIQAQAIPEVLNKRDVMGIAQTGTGKTASFVLPMLSLLERGRARARMPRTLILEPTRELAAQVEENFKRYGQNHKLTVALLIGGVSFEEQLKKLDRGADVLIATPGRLLDHFERGKLLMTGVDILVIDEADRMLDMGFIPDIERIAKLVPFTRQTLFFSATMPPEIERLSGQFLQNPVQIEAAPPSTASATIDQRAVGVPIEDYEKRAVLRELINGADNLKNAIVFCNRKVDVSNLWRSLERHGFSAGALHGDMDQTSRMATLDAFRSNKITILVASDVAARGLDIPDVSHIFNFDVPVTAEDYVHRIGRTGRAGRNGSAFMLVSPADRKGFHAIEKLIGETIEWDGDEVEWDDKAGKRRRSTKSGKDEKSGSGRSSRKSQSSRNRKADREIEEPVGESTMDIAPADFDAQSLVEAEGTDRTKSRKPKKGAGKSRRSSSDNREVGILEPVDASHPFGGEENIPAFLR